MTLPAHTVHVPAGLGIDEATRPELVGFGTKNLAAINVRQDQRGCLDPRNGFAALSTQRLDASSATVGYSMFPHRDTTVRVTETPSAEVYALQTGRWTPVGRLPEATYSLSELPSMGIDGFAEDIEHCNGYLVVSYRGPSPTGAGSSPADMFIAVLDAATLAPVRLVERVIAGASYPLLASYGTYVVAFSANDSTTTIAAYILNTASAATLSAGWVSLATVGTDWSALLGVSVCSLEDRVAIAYVNTSVGTSRVSVKTYDATGLLQSTTINTSSVTPRAVDVAGSNADTLWVAWDETTSVKAIGLTGNSLSTIKATTSLVMTMATAARLIYLSPFVSVPGACRMATTDTATSARTHMRNFVTTSGAVNPTGGQLTSYGAVMSSRPFMQGGRHYATFFVGSIVGSNATSPGVGNTQQTHILCDWTDLSAFVRPVVNVNPGLAIQTFYGKAKSAAVSSTKRITCCHLVRSSVGYAPTLVTMDFANAKRWQAAALASTTFIGGGVTSYFDGRRIAEVGFLARPTQPTMTTGGTGITAATGWRYVAVYEEVDGDGNWVVSGVSDPSASTGAVANKTVTVSTTALAVSARISADGNSATSVRVAWYRTLDNGGLAPYYRLGTTLNNPGVAALTYVDSTLDTTLQAAAKLYSQPGVAGTAQDRRPPPGLLNIVSYGGMLVGSTGSDIWYSGQNITGEGAWFNPIFQVPIPGAGDITALWVMDGALYIAKRREIYSISGDAPSDNGSSGGLGIPRRLAVDVGCIEPRSVCVTALGTFFQSDRGIEILTRSQSVEWIGEGVQETLTSFPTVTSAIVEPAASVVYIELAEGESSARVVGNGRTLVFDLTIKDWVSTDRRASSAGDVDAPAQSACMVNIGAASPRYGWLDTTGVVHYENIASHLDADGSFVVPSFETGWLKHGLQQQQRVWDGMILFERNGPAGLKIEQAYDYEPYSSANDKVWPETTIGSRRQVDWRPKMLGQAMKFRVSVTAPASLGTAQGLTLIGLSFTAAPKQGSTTGLKPLATSVRK